MRHLLILLYGLAVGGGFAALAVVFQMYARQRDPFLRHYLGFLALINVTAGGNLILRYLGVNLSGLVLWIDPERFVVGLLLFSSLLVAGFAFELIAMLFALLDQSITSRWRNTFGLVVVGALAALVMAWLVAGVSPLVVVAIVQVINFSLVATAMITIVWAWARSRSIAHRPYRKSVRQLCLGHFVVFFLMPAAALFSGPYPWYVLFVAFMSINVIPLALLRRLVESRQAAALGEPPSTRTLAAFSARHGISGREEEIICLVLAGRTNAEVAESLSISQNTVKNHIYNVYRKAGVRNRVELANLTRSFDTEAVEISTGG
jgi:DNA-binding CsgD family transcriptional regulator